MNQILAIETSLPDGSLALQNGDEIQEIAFQSDRLHNADLFPLLTRLFPESQLAQLDLIIIGTGPGSYNGSRIAIAAAQGMGVVHDCPVIGIPSFFAVPFLSRSERCTFIGDARRQSYFQIDLNLDEAGHQLQLHEGPHFQDIFAQLPRPFTFEDPKRLPLTVVQQETISVEIPEAKKLIQVWHQFDQKKQTSLLKDPPQPFYLRPPHITKAKEKRRY